tara:strand:+ start:39398 stop:39589 length:192 start_codon:yes stop_codon:yes gene_type:complete
MLKRFFFNATVAVALWFLMAFCAYHFTSVMNEVNGLFWVMFAVLGVISIAIAAVVNLVLKIQS